MFQMYKALEDGKPFLGRRTRKVKWAYISGDRPEASVRETMANMGVDFKVFSLVDRALIDANLVSIIIPQLTRFYGYRPNFIYIDGFSALSPDGKFNDYRNVAMWLGELQRYCSSKGVTILGACHTTKTKEGAKFLNPRQRIAGSIAWAGYSETIVLVEPFDEEAKGSQRMISLLPRNHTQEFLTLQFNDQGFLEDPPEAKEREKEASAAEKAIPTILTLVPGSTLDYRACMEAVMAAGHSRSTWDRWLARQVEDGKLIHPKKGIYVVASVNSGDEVPTTSGNQTDSSDHHKGREEETPEAEQRREDAPEPQEEGQPEDEDFVFSQGRGWEVQEPEIYVSLSDWDSESGEITGDYRYNI